MKSSAWLLAVLLLDPAVAQPPERMPAPSIHPSGTSVPENLLRIEFRFAKPWHGTLDMRHVRLLDADDRAIENAFLDLPLASTDGRQVSVLLHPARVKSGVGANLDAGRALHAGSTVTLLIDDPQLAQPIRKRWLVTGADVRPPEPARWSFRSPLRGGRSALVVQLDDPVGASAVRLIAVRAPDGSRMQGTASLSDGETTWRFVPAQPWRPGRYAIATHPDLEDPSGNRVCAPFEATAAAQAACASDAERSFSVSP